MKFTLLALFVAAAVAGPDCTPLQNPQFDFPDIINPWLTSSFNGGVDFCRAFPAGDINQCQLTQQNAIGLDNSGRIATGRSECRCNGNANNNALSAACTPLCSGEGSQGVNVYQNDIKVCPYMRISARIGIQDTRNNNAPRPPVTFSLVVAPNADALASGNHFQIGSTTLEYLEDTPRLAVTGDVEGVFYGSKGGKCGKGSSCYQCHTVGIRVERDGVISPAQRNYFTDFLMIDETAPRIKTRNVYARAPECGGVGSVDVSYSIRTRDNCCDEPTLQCSLQPFNNGGKRGANQDPWDCTGSRDYPIGCTTVYVSSTDNAATASNATVDNVSYDQFEVCVSQPRPKITCNNVMYDAEACVSKIPEDYVEQNGEIVETVSCDGTTTYSQYYDQNAESYAEFMFNLGRNKFRACVEQNTGLGDKKRNKGGCGPKRGKGGCYPGETEKVCCDVRVYANLCCEKPVFKPRSEKRTLVSELKKSA